MLKEKRPEKLPSGNEWVFDNRNVLLNPRVYPYHVTNPTGVLADFVDFAQEELLHPEWQFKDILIYEKKGHSPTVVTVFTHPMRDLMKPVSSGYARADRTTELSQFVLSHAINENSGRLNIDFSPVFNSSPYEVRLGDVNHNVVGYEGVVKKRKYFLFHEEIPTEEYWMQLGVGYIVLGLKHYDQIINELDSAMFGQTTLRDMRLDLIDRQIQRLQTSLTKVEAQRAREVDRFEGKISTIETRIAEYKELLAQSTKTLL